MSSRTTGKNFFEAHWDWLIALAGLAAVGASFVYNFTLAEEVEEVVLSDGKSAEVEAVDLTTYTAVTNGFLNPCQLAAVDGEQASFLATGLRVYCAPGDPAVKGCGKPIVFGDEKCPFCGVSQKTDEKPTDDHDGDGIPDDYEKQHGLDPTADDADLDKDDDGFTNLEEFLAGTDPSDPKSHPDYLTAFTLDKELVQTYTTLCFDKVMYKMGDKSKLQFSDPSFKKEYNSGIFQAVTGEEIKFVDPKKKVVTTGFILKSYAEKSRKQKIGGGMEKTIDISEAVVERVKDKKLITLVTGVKKTPTDFQATLVFDRIASKGEQRFKVIDGQEIEVNGCKYKVEDIRKTAKSHSVKVTNLASGESRVIEALEQ